MSKTARDTLNNLMAAVGTTLIPGEKEKVLNSTSITAAVCMEKLDELGNKPISLKGTEAVLPSNLSSSFATNSSVQRVVSLSLKFPRSSSLFPLLSQIDFLNIPEPFFKIEILTFNRPYSYSQYWTGTSLQWRLMRGNLFKCNYFLIYSPALASIAS